MPTTNQSIFDLITGSLQRRYCGRETLPDYEDWLDERQREWEDRDPAIDQPAKEYPAGGQRT